MSSVGGPDQQIVTPSFVGQSQGSSAVAGNFLLQEDGVSKILLEDFSGFILLE